MPSTTRKTKDPRTAVLRALGERIRDHRRHRKLSQQSMAREVGLSLAYISLIERGLRNPPYTRVVAIARVLGLSASRLVE